MRKLPFMGTPQGEWAVFVCGFGGMVPGDVICGRDSTWHGFVLDDPAEHIVAMMTCCDGHLRYMKLTADFVHPLEHPCGIPGSRFRWPENECFTDWDETSEFTQLAALEGAQ